MTSASRSSLTPSDGREALDRADEQVGAADDAGERDQRPGAPTIRRRGTARVATVAAPVEPVEAQRRQVVLVAPRASASKWPFTYQA